MGLEGKLLVSRKNKESIGIDKDLTKDRYLSTFKNGLQAEKEQRQVSRQKARNHLHACHCIAGHEKRLFVCGAFTKHTLAHTHKHGDT